jgi:RimJ/RimL family protein N-acetyltransferase
MLSGNLVNLRPIRKGDLDHIQVWINDLEVQYYSQEEYPFYFNHWMIKYIYNDGIKGKKRILMIEDKAGQVIGELWLHPIDYVRKIADLVIVIGKRNLRGRGYGRDAIRTVKKYCFETLGFEAIYLKVFSFNTRAIKCYKACGFQTIGKGSKMVNRNGRLYDELVMEVRREPRE